MKAIAYTALHYGKSYLGYAIKSVIDYVDEYWVLYSAVGSHGFHTDVPCPEKRDELYAIAHAVAGDKLHWIDGEWQHEGFQRDSIFEYVPDADVIVVLDSDEIWQDHLVGFAIDQAWRFGYQHLRIPFRHYWRSFYRCILHDPAYPVRVYVPKAFIPESTLQVNLAINHMGYAQPASIVEYKQLTHGHRSQWRTDVDWFQDRFLANAQKDCHPVGSEFWNPEPVNPWDYMPKFMKHHPFAQLEVIP
jgi:hypothetical protein